MSEVKNGNDAGLVIKDKFSRVPMPRLEVKDAYTGRTVDILQEPFYAAKAIYMPQVGLEPMCAERREWDVSDKLHVLPLRGCDSYILEYGKNYVRLYVSPTPPLKTVPAHRRRRQKIYEFSSKSRLRLKRVLLRVEFDPAYMVTLTYPRFYPASASEWKRHLKVFLARLKRFLGKREYAYCWKLEPQKRGAPHFHILLWFLDADFSAQKFFITMREWVRKAWADVVGAPERYRHREAGTRVDLLKGKRGYIQRYVGKYIGKKIGKLQEWQFPGRFWGTSRNISVLQRYSVRLLKEDSFNRIRRIMRKLVEKRVGRKVCFISATVSLNGYRFLSSLRLILDHFSREMYLPSSFCP